MQFQYDIQAESWLSIVLDRTSQSSCSSLARAAGSFKTCSSSSSRSSSFVDASSAALQAHQLIQSSSSPHHHSLIDRLIHLKHRSKYMRTHATATGLISSLTALRTPRTSMSSRARILPSDATMFLIPISCDADINACALMLFGSAVHL